MRFDQAFPTFAAAEPETLDWGAPFAWSATDTPELLEALWTVQCGAFGALPRLTELTEALIADLATQRQLASDEATRDTIDCARFISCMPMLQATGSAGQIGATYNWVWRAISHTHDSSSRVNSNVVSYLALPGAPADLMNLYLNYVPNFADAAFHVAYKLGGLDAFADLAAAGSWECCRALYDTGDGAAVSALVQMTIWAAHKDNSFARPFAAELEALLAKEGRPAQRKAMMMAFLTYAYRYTGRDPKQWAARLLAEHNPDLVQHERLQVLAVLVDSPEEWDANRADVLAEIAALRALYLENLSEGESDLEVLEARVSIIHPLLSGFARWGKVSDVLEALRAWYLAPGTEASDDEVLVVVPTHEGGATYLWPTGRLMTGTGSVASHDAMQRAASEALGSYYRGQDGDRNPAEYADRRFDVIVPEAGYVLLDAMRAHYQIGRLEAALPQGWCPRSLVVIPAGPEPVQALLAAELDLTAPIEATFAAASPERTIRRVSVWAAGVMHEEFELEALQNVADSAGWTLAIHRHEAPTANDFKTFYEDAQADVLWVISHGTHDPFTVTETGLNLDHATLLTLEELRALSLPMGQRRLLVLNSCSGATVQGRGGVAGIGVAQVLASADQLVVGNLWPVHWSVGLAFGAALAACLAHASPREAFFTAAALMREPAKLLDFLGQRFASAPGLLERLERSGEDFESLMAWGCPILLT